MKITIDIRKDYLGSIESGIEIECDNVFELENIINGLQHFFTILGVD